MHESQSLVIKKHSKQWFSFRRVIKDPDLSLKDKNIKKVVICSGKVFYNLYEER